MFSYACLGWEVYQKELYVVVIGFETVVLTVLLTSLSYGFSDV